MRVLVTGGAGFIGSHTCLELLQTEYEVIKEIKALITKTRKFEKIKNIS